MPRRNCRDELRYRSPEKPPLCKATHDKPEVCKRIDEASRSLTYLRAGIWITRMISPIGVIPH